MNCERMVAFLRRECEQARIFTVSDPDDEYNMGQ